jgi:LPS-assembly protein
MTHREIGGCLLMLAFSARAASAQLVPGIDSVVSRLQECTGADYCHFTGDVEFEFGDTKLYADEVEVFIKETRLVAVGNVVLTSPTSNISSDRLEFNWKTRTGMFFEASGSASLGDRVERSLFGTQEPDAYFYGQQIEKLGPKKYRITRGGFTTCVQPTPRWQITSTSAVLNLDDYALLRNSLLRVKGIPVLYLPVFYYPIQEDDRATGFLLPTYGSSTIRGQSLSNAFFWAISRSQDATFLHDWFTRTGQGAGGEYRYVAGRGSDGSARIYLLNEHASTFTVTSGGSTFESSSPARRSYELRASAAQALPGGLRARGRVDYFSNVTVQQLYHQNIYEASQRSRTVTGSISGGFGTLTVNGLFDWRESFFGETFSTLYGSLPRVSVSRAARPIAGLPLYFSVGGEFARLLYEDRVDGAAVTDRGLNRFDATPTLRMPFKRWPFLTVNSAVAWRVTHYSESLDARGVQVPEPLVRQYFDLRSDVVGPVVTRVWNTPASGYAEKFKHVIEPTVSFQRVTSIDNRDRIVLLSDGGDYVVGGTTRIAYGLTNRFLAKRRGGEADRGRSREFASVTINQSYYSDARASQFDQSYVTSFRGRAPSNFSTVAIGVRLSPTDRLSGGLRLEYDPEIGAFQSFTASGAAAFGDWLETRGGWSQRRLTVDQRDPNRIELDNYLNGSASIRAWRNRVGTSYSFNYDLGRSTLLQQRIVGHYNAQCCGFAVEYQTFDFPASSRFVVPQDRRFNLSFTLAGIGTFSNIFGAFGGGNR